jgi:hypothetical protein
MAGSALIRFMGDALELNSRQFRTDPLPTIPQSAFDRPSRRGYNQDHLIHARRMGTPCVIGQFATQASTIFSET